MSEIIISNIYKSFGANDVLKGTTFEINKGYVYGIVGNNGCGKSTLFRIITGEINKDSGDIFMRSGIKAGYLEQLPQMDEDKTVTDILNTAFEEIHSIEDKMRRLERDMSLKNGEYEIYLKQYSNLQIRYETAGGHDVPEKVKKVTQGLNINEKMQSSKFNDLSGGEKTRVLLGKLLLTNTDVLLLDEPTNHLDISSIEWLEKFISSYRGTVVIISHDRYFLDLCANFIVEISEGKAETYKGNYSAYIIEREKNIHKQDDAYQRQQKEIKRLADRARQLHDWANNEKTHRKAFAIEKRIERIERIDKPVHENKIKINVDSQVFKGKELLKMQDLSFSYKNENSDTKEKVIFKEAGLMLYNGENTAVLGPNGCGKTTLIKLLVGEIGADKGHFSMGASVKYAYLPQNVTFENADISILEMTQRELELKSGEARNLLAKYNFTGEDVFKEISVLSGGEKSRLRLCILLHNKINFLILDEPTNHLDISSREVLENMLSEFEGALLFISHDRYFIRKFANTIVDIEEHKLNKYEGNYDLYTELKEEEKQRRQNISNALSDILSNMLNDEKDIPQNQKSSGEERKKAEKRAKDPWRIKKHAEIEEQIQQKEEIISFIEAQLFMDGKGYDEILRLTEQKESINKEIEELLILWEKYS